MPNRKKKEKEKTCLLIYDGSDRYVIEYNILILGFGKMVFAMLLC